MAYFQLSSENFATLQKVDLTKLNGQLRLYETKNAVEVEEICLLLILLNEEISLAGMTDDQQEVNSYGQALYALYDELLSQR